MRAAPAGITHTVPRARRCYPAPGGIILLPRLATATRKTPPKSQPEVQGHCRGERRRG